MSKGMNVKRMTVYSWNVYRKSSLSRSWQINTSIFWQHVYTQERQDRQKKRKKVRFFFSHQ